LVAFVLGGGTLAFVVFENQSVLDSLYMTVITLSTVGYSEVFPLDEGGRVITMVLIILGYIAVAVAAANFVSLLVGGELRAIREGVRMKATIDKLDRHVIICGYGRMGQQIAEHLRRDGVSYVVIDREAADDMFESGVLFVHGDATEDVAMESAGIARARALVSCLSSDADNVYVTLSARGMRPDLTIIARAEQPTTEAKLCRAGANAVICPQMIGAQKTANLLSRPHVVELFDMAHQGGDFEIARYDIAADSVLNGRVLRESGIRERANLMVVAIKRADGTQQFSPGPEERMHAGDQLVLLGPVGEAPKLDTLE